MTDHTEAMEALKHLIGVHEANIASNLRSIATSEAAIANMKEYNRKWEQSVADLKSTVAALTK